MKSIEINYKAKRTENKLTFQLPERWEELTTEQLTMIADVLFYQPNEGFSKILLIPSLGGLDKKEYLLFMRAVEDNEEMLEAAAVLHDALDWVFEPGKIEESLIVEYEDWEGPAGLLDNLTFDQYYLAEAAYASFIESKNESDLNDLISVLYMPKNQEFREARLPFVKRSVAQWPLDVREAMLLNFHLLRNAFADRYSAFYGKEQDTDKKSDPFWGIRVKEMLAGEVWGSVTTLGARPVHEVFTTLIMKLNDNVQTS
jgi:hypothetical protein